MGDMTEYYTEGIEFGKDVNGVPLCDKCRTYHSIDEECDGD